MRRQVLAQEVVEQEKVDQHEIAGIPNHDHDPVEQHLPGNLPVTLPAGHIMEELDIRCAHPTRPAFQADIWRQGFQPAVVDAHQQVGQQHAQKDGRHLTAALPARWWRLSRELSSRRAERPPAS